MTVPHLLRRRVRISIAAIFALFAGAAQAECPADNWTNTPPGSFRGKAIPADRYKPVQGQLRDEAERLMADHPYRELAPNEARQFGGKAVAGMKAYILRGTAFNEANGGFSLAIDGTKLWVRHDSLGPITKLKCAPVLVYLRNAPVEVFVSAASDQ
jgi:hypothetical protein